MKVAKISKEKNSVVRITEVQEYFNKKPFVGPVAEELVKQFKTNGEVCLSSKEIKELVKYGHLTTSSRALQEARYNYKDGKGSESYLNKGIALAISALRQSKCLIDCGRKYRINEEMSWYLTHDSDKHYREIVKNFDRKTFINLPEEYSKTYPPKTKVVLIKKNGERQTSYVDSDVLNRIA